MAKTSNLLQPVEEHPVASEPPLQTSAAINSLSKSFVAKKRSVNALKDVNLRIRQGEYVVILGPSGCGKSTLLRCISGLETPTAGTIDLSGRMVFEAGSGIDVKPNLRNVGMVFQNYALWPQMTVEANVAYPLKMRKVAKKDRAQKVARVLEAVECSHLAARLPAELSGGQQQRIALARALVYEPSILLLDEPLSNLDALLRISLRSELLRLHRELGFTAIHITHDQEEALEMGDRVVLMREGRIEQIGRPQDVYARPVSPYAADFLGIRNRIKVKVSRGNLIIPSGAEIGHIPGTSNLKDGDTLEMFVRGSATRLGIPAAGDSQSLHLEGTLAQQTLGEGGRPQFVVDIDGAQWFVQHPEGMLPEPGEQLTIHFSLSDALFYRDDELINLSSEV